MSNDENNAEQISHKIERYKAVMDYIKQLTTLSTASILLIVSFVEKVFPAAQWKPLTAVSLIGFMLSIVCAIIAHTIGLFDFPPRETEQPDWERKVGGGALILTWIGFLIGILSLAIFAAKNFLQ
jgi:hypothetical protein